MVGDAFFIAGVIGLVVFANPYGMIILAFDDTRHRKSNIRAFIVGSVVSLLLVLIGIALEHLK